MRRFFRYLSNALTVLSLVLCVATLCAWPVTRHRLAWVLWNSDSEYWVASAGGVLRFAMSIGDRPQYGTDGLSFLFESDSFSRISRYTQPMVFFGEFRDVQTAGFGLDVGHTLTSPRGGYKSGGKPYLILYLPHWFVAMGFGGLPALLVAHLRRKRRRRKAGNCPNCGYDLRATPERCPECGAVPATRGEPA